jgi:DNA polymerase (family 10)
MDKKKVAEVLEEIGALLELRGENPFKSRAYTNAARAIRGLQEDIGELVKTRRLREIKGVGEAIQQKITELVTTGELKYHLELRAPYPPGFHEMMQVPGLGPKKLKVLWETLGIASLGELEYACRENRLRELEGFGEKSQEKILKGIEFFKRHRGLHLSNFARKEGEALLQSLSLCPDVTNASLAGSLRRRCEISADIDLVASSANPAGVMQYFTTLPQIEGIVARGDTKSSVTLTTGINADLRVVTEREFPYALHHFTGSKEHNTALRGRAKGMGMKMNEYGLFRGEELIPCVNEEEIFAALGLAYIPPELRENTGEIEAAQNNSLPDLVTESQIRGVLHVHSIYSDGSNTLEQMIQAAIELGYSYVGISDHSKSAFYARGLKEEDIKRQHAELDVLQGKFPQIRILKGIESDILADGSLDYAPEILSSFDFVIGSIHGRFNMTEEEMTARILRALENPFLTVLGHPTGRLLLAREPYPVDIERIIDAAVARGVAIEINAHPHRLDLDWRFGRYAAKMGAMVSINPDAHSTRELANVTYGVGIARKSWLVADQVLNTRDAAGFLAFSHARR